jgi:hypothetical protein
MEDETFYLCQLNLEGKKLKKKSRRYMRYSAFSNLRTAPLKNGHKGRKRDFNISCSCHKKH